MKPVAFSQPVEVRCPACGRFLAETAWHARCVCADCGWEVTVRSAQARKERRRETGAGI